MIELIRTFVIPAAYAVLPPMMRSPKATAQLLAIGLQESKFRARAQRKGPARGFWQFEVAGVKGVLAHDDTIVPIGLALEALCYPPTLEPAEIQRALADNDVLAACFARCLLWTLPEALPGPDEPSNAWEQYLRAWRPGRPRPAVWGANYDAAWRLVQDVDGLETDSLRKDTPE